MLGRFSVFVCLVLRAGYDGALCNSDVSPATMRLDNLPENEREKFVLSPQRREEILEAIKTKDHKSPAVVAKLTATSSESLHPNRTPLLETVVYRKNDINQHLTGSSQYHMEIVKDLRKYEHRADESWWCYTPSKVVCRDDRIFYEEFIKSESFFGEDRNAILLKTLKHIVEQEELKAKIMSSFILQRWSGNYEKTNPSAKYPSFHVDSPSLTSAAQERNPGVSLTDLVESKDSELRQVKRWLVTIPMGKEAKKFLNQNPPSAQRHNDSAAMSKFMKVWNMKRDDQTTRKTTHAPAMSEQRLSPYSTGYDSRGNPRPPLSLPGATVYPKQGLFAETSAEDDPGVRRRLRDPALIEDVITFFEEGDMWSVDYGMFTGHDEFVVHAHALQHSDRLLLRMDFVANVFDEKLDKLGAEKARTNNKKKEGKEKKKGEEGKRRQK